LKPVFTFGFKYFFTIFATDLLKVIYCEEFIENQISGFLPNPAIFQQTEKELFSVTGFSSLL